MKIKIVKYDKTTFSSSVFCSVQFKSRVNKDSYKNTKTTKPWNTDDSQSMNEDDCSQAMEERNVFTDTSWQMKVLFAPHKHPSCLPDGTSKRSCISS